jgi:predicted SAM-dependent methyltransferase
MRSANGSPKEIGLPGRLVMTDDPLFGGRVFYMEKGIRHWVISSSYFEPYGFVWPTDVNKVSAREIQDLKIGGPLPWPWTERDMRQPPKRDWTSLRELSACTLRGRGIEFGAGTAPFCVPPGCDVEFADFFSKPQLFERSYKSQLEANADFVDLQYVTTIEEISGVPDESLDFIVACHVIEHTRNPVKAIARSFECLKKGGKLVLVVPDKRLTFDKTRELTTLEHNIADYMHPDTQRDEQHYFDYCRNVMGISDDTLDSFVRSAIERNMDLHFHVWTYDSFLSLTSYIKQNLVPWSDIWSHPPGTGDIANEFYFVLTK